MFQTLYGLALVVVGLLIVIFGEHLARLSNRLKKRLLGIEFPLNFGGTANTILGSACSFFGLLVLLRLVIIR